MVKRLSGITKKGDDDMVVDVRATGQLWKSKIEKIEDAAVKECVADFMRGMYKRMETSIKAARRG